MLRDCARKVLATRCPKRKAREGRSLPFSICATRFAICKAGELDSRGASEAVLGAEIKIEIKKRKNIIYPSPLNNYPIIEFFDARGKGCYRADCEKAQKSSVAKEGIFSSAG